MPETENFFYHTREELIDLVNDGIDELGCTVDDLWIAISRVTNVRLAEKQKAEKKKQIAEEMGGKSFEYPTG